jgi:hypothetical protein
MRYAPRSGGQTIDQGRGHDFIPEDLAPLLETLI